MLTLPGDGLVSQLDYCAKSRLALSAVAVLLNEVLSKRNEVAHADRILASAADLVLRSPVRRSLQRYFVRSLVALFRKDLVFEWKESGVVPELMPEEIRGAIQYSPENWHKNCPKKCPEFSNCSNSYFLNFFNCTF